MGAPALPAEYQVVLACARARRDGETTRRLRELCAAPLDWSLVVDTAFGHGLMPLVAWQLSQCADLVPSATMQRLRERFQRNAVRNVALTTELGRLLGLLAAHGIAAIPYKGPALAMLAYGDLALRHFVDLDILVRKDDVLPASRILMAEGYRAHLSLTLAQEAAFLDQHCEYAFGRERDGSSVELHWEIVPPEFGLPVSGWRLWDDLRPISLLGRPAFSPAAEDLLVILCAHGSKHLWNRLGWICDVAELIRSHPGLDWPRALDRARALGAERMVRLGLALAAQLMEVELPPRVGAQIAADRHTRGLAARIGHWLVSGTLPPERSLREARVHLAMRERLRDKLRYARRLAFTGTIEDWQSTPLPRSLFFLYGVLRPLRLARKHWRGRGVGG
jgi:hypothetical protein